MSELTFKIRDTFTEELESEWLHLSKLSEISLFQNYSWQSCWFENIHLKYPKTSLIIISIYYNKRIIGILPFEKKNYFNINILNFTGNPFADYCDCVLDLNFLKSEYNLKYKIQKFIFSLKNIDLIMFDKINESSHFCFLFDKSVLRKKNYKSHQLIKKNDAYDLISKKFLSDTSRQSKRLNLLGKITYKIASTTSEKENVLKFFFIHKRKQLISTNSWNYLNNEIYRNFLNKLFQYADSHLSYLSLNDKMIAVHLGYIKNNKLTYLFPTYNREYSNYSPGNILLVELMNIFFKNNGKEFDFTTGDELYKIRLSNFKQEIFFKYISLTAKGYFLSMIFRISNYIKKIKVLQLLFQKIRY